MNQFLLEETLRKFRKATEHPADFLETNEELTNRLKSNMKETYDFMKKEEIKHLTSNSLSNLILKDFHLEQIWQQIELQNDDILNMSVIRLSKLLISKDKLLFKNLEEYDNNIREKHIDDSPSETSKEHELFPEFELQLNENTFDEESVSSNEDKTEYNVEKTKSSKRSVVDDEFFNLSEMEGFLKMEEKKLADPDSGNDSVSDDEEESLLDLFEADKENTDEEQDARMARFKDYFLEKETLEKNAQRNKLMERLEEESSSENDIHDGVKSTLELRQDRLKRKIEEIEEQAIGEKPWQLKGEVTAEGRPQNSLLEEVVEFDLTSRPAPVITEHTSLQLEDIIKQRIKDKAFDSVERKVKPIETPLEYKKKLVLDQDKSKQSLAQIYEKEYLEKQATVDPENAEKQEELSELHKEVQSLMKNLFSKLDALSNFHFTSKPAIPELKIVSNLPAINMEEVAPVAVSDANLLAPEEVKNKPKGDVIGKTERTRADKKRERRKKKLKQKIHSQVKLKKLAQKNTVVDGVPKKYGIKGNKSKTK